MFLPLGLGGRLKVFPFSTLFIALICVCWSFHFFANLENLKAVTKGEISKKLAEQKKKVLDSTIKPKISECLKSGMKKNCLSQVERSVAQFKNKSENWGPELQQLPEYRVIQNLEAESKKELKKVYRDNGFLTLETLSLFNIVQASFSHAGYVHLFSNLLFLFLFGIWVEQRVKAFITFTVFLLGSFAGLGLQIILAPEMSVLGASAGVYALMGVFFSLFYHTKMTFLFVIFPVYAKKIVLPAMWTLPFIFMVGEFSAFISRNPGMVSHAAHIGGLSFGLLLGLYLRKADKLPSGFLFMEEFNHAQNISQSNDSKFIWREFQELVTWNPKNWSVLRLILRRLNEQQLAITHVNQKRLLETLYADMATEIRDKNFKLSFKDLILLKPQALSSRACFVKISNTDLIPMADRLANSGNFQLASSLYSVALTKEPSKFNKKKIVESLNYIQEQINNQLETKIRRVP